MSEKIRQLTEDEVRNALIENQSVEFEPNRVDYYLHITLSGDIVPSRTKAAESFIVSAYPADYGYTQQQWESDEAAAEDIYDHEIKGDPVFDRIVRDLTKQANEWLAK